MKRKNRILSFVAILLVAVYLAGSAGAVIVRHTCDSCGLSELHTEFFSSESAHDGCNCSTEPESGHGHHDASIENDCCSFNSDKLSLTDYTNIKVVSLSINTIPAIVNETVATDEFRLIHTSAATVCNKHGGRDIIRQTCQLLI